MPSYRPLVTKPVQKFDFSAYSFAQATISTLLSYT